MKNKNFSVLNTLELSLISLLISLGVSVLARFAKPFAYEISKLRQLDNPMILILSILCVVVVSAILIIAFVKKTKGDFAPYGLLLSGLMMYLYSIIDSERMINFLYMPAIQKFMANSDIHVNVTTLHASKMFAEGLNMLLCALTLILLCACAVSLIRNIQLQKAQNAAVSVAVPAFAGAAAAYTVWGALANAFGYAVMFSVTALIIAFAGLVLCALSLVKSK